MNAGLEWTLTVWGGLAVLLAIILIWLVVDHRREVGERRRLAEAERSGRHIAASLHPVIDPQICIGTAACVAACPEGDILGMVDGFARLIHGAACIGHGRCAAECPVGAIRLVFGSAERGIDIPQVTADFESSRAGIYVAGELGGMGLIKNAIRQGVGAARHAIAHRDRSVRDRLGVIVIGAGPAGLGAGLTCLEAGVSYAVIERESVGGTAAHYPRQKLVMTEPVDVPAYGRIHRAEMSKEELMAQWAEILAETGLRIQTGQILTGIDGEDGDFTVHTSAGSLRGQKVILAVGRRGNPRRLGIPGEESARVCYRLDDAEQYRGRRLLVVGGGDSALEAAMDVAEQPGATVTLVYRGEGFPHAKPKNQERLAAMRAEGRLTVRLQTAPTRIDEVDGGVVVHLHSQAGEARADIGDDRLAVDQVIAALGGEAPTALLTQLGIRLDRWFGKVPGAEASTRISVRDASRSGFGIASVASLAIGLLGIAALMWLGREYYPLTASAREASRWHELLRPSGLVGHGIGVVATAVMLTNFFYAARKRLRVFQRLGQIRRWLTLHVIVGAMTPAVILFHAAFQSRNLVATVSYGAVTAVMVTGAINRWIYGALHGSRAGGARRFRHLMGAWRMLHILLAGVMVVTIVAHVAVSWLFGYRWIF